MPEMALLIADPNSSRRTALLRRFGDLTGLPAIGAATLGEAYRALELALPAQIAVSGELSGLREFAMLEQMSRLTGSELLIYGNQSASRTQAARLGIIREDELIRRLAGSRPQALQSLRDPALAPRPLGDFNRCEQLSQAASALSAPRQAAALAESPVDHVICIGASTGGISALEAILGAFGADCPPTLVVQHIRSGFAEGLVRRLDQSLVPRVVAATDGAVLAGGTVYLATDTTRHLGLTFRAGLRLRLIPGAPVSGHRPSVDVLFREAAALASRTGVAAALLTGMGSDGAEGMAALRAAGALTIAQDQHSSVVWGMPRVAIERGAAAEVLPVGRIGGALLRHAATPGRPR